MELYYIVTNSTAGASRTKLGAGGSLDREWQLDYASNEEPVISCHPCLGPPFTPFPGNVTTIIP